MGPTSPSILDRLAVGAVQSSTSALQRSPRRSPSEYQLHKLEPRPDDASSLDEKLQRAGLRKLAAKRETSPVPWQDRPSSADSSKPGQPPMLFAPPPIAPSTVMTKASGRHRLRNHDGANPSEFLATSRASIANILFGQGRDFAPHTSDAAWRRLRWGEKTLEQNIQRLLDLQAAALAAGSTGGMDAKLNDGADGHSEAGSGTPTGTFYFTPSSTSHMPKKLSTPPHSAPLGNAVPVRQPPKPRPMGLRAARNGLQRSMTALADLRREEEAYVDTAISERRMALARLNLLSTRKAVICKELRVLERDDDEGLGKELRVLETKRNLLDDEMRLLEEKLAGMRNRRRWLVDKIDDVKSKRETGLSGYRDTLKDVEAEVDVLMRRPPVQPLDQDMLSRGNAAHVGASLTGGVEFMRLIPERRTAEKARLWWETDIEVLEQRKSQIGAEQQALDEGSAAWHEVTSLVTDFEANLRGILKAGTNPSAPPSAKGKGNAEPLGVQIRSQLVRMGELVMEVEERMRLAETKRWNLLICAVGAELDALKAAHDVLKEVVDDANGGGPNDTHVGASPGTVGPGTGGKLGRGEGREESDNEVPPDLLISPLEHAYPESAASHGCDAAPMQRQDTENEVPREFLAEHDHSSDHRATARRAST